LWTARRVADSRRSFVYRIDARVEGLLMAGAAFGWENARSALVILVASTGVVVGSSTFYATRTAVETMREQTDWWTNHSVEDYRGPDVIGHRVEHLNWWMLRPSLALPSVFVVPFSK
jgi:hypothetical protein